MHFPSSRHSIRDEQDKKQSVPKGEPLWTTDLVRPTILCAPLSILFKSTLMKSGEVPSWWDG